MSQPIGGYGFGMFVSYMSVLVYGVEDRAVLLGAATLGAVFLGFGMWLARGERDDR